MSQFWGMWWFGQMLQKKSKDRVSRPRRLFVSIAQLGCGFSYNRTWIM